VVERVDRPSVATFLAPEPLVGGGSVRFGEDVTHHMRVRRLAEGDRVGLRDGVGGVAWGTLRQLAKGFAVVDVGAVARRERQPPVHLVVPVADRDRTLWLAEKAVELGAASWRPVLWNRSRGVASRAEGPGFEGKLRARMAAALAQSEGAWLPSVHPSAPLDAALAALDAGVRLLLDPDGEPLVALPLAPPVTIAIGPEGGVERVERDRLVDAGFRPAALPGNILRFETAGVVALALVLAPLTT
jgi:16S rRNA (uracil1498-N3)-methyltransferase